MLPGQVAGYEYLRIESRADGVYYVAMPSGKNEAAFKLASSTTRRQRRDLHVRESRRPSSRGGSSIAAASGGWLYAKVEGKVKGADRQVIYPMRRIDCETGEFIRK